MPASRARRSGCAKCLSCCVEGGRAFLRIERSQGAFLRLRGSRRVAAGVHLPPPGHLAVSLPETPRVVAGRRRGARREALPSKLENEFHDAMLDVYRRAKSEAGYTATRFLGMVSERGGLETARYLLHAPTVSDGYAALWERGRLDLTVEAVILDAKWDPLFSRQERHIAVGRLREYGFAGQLRKQDPED